MFCDLSLGRIKSFGLSKKCVHFNLKATDIGHQVSYILFKIFEEGLVYNLFFPHGHASVGSIVELK